MFSSAKRKLAAALITASGAVALAGCGSAAHHQSAGGSVHPNGWGGTPHGITLPTPLFGWTTSTATMYDAVTVSNIPAHPFAAAGYTAGNWITWPQVRAIASHAVSIAISARFHADCLDVEPGDATPSQAGAWAIADIRAGFAKPCLYSDLSEMPAVKASLQAAGLARSSYFLWLAWYRDIPGLVAGYDAVQYWDHCLGRNLDCSTVSLAFLSIAQPPYVAPVPKPAPNPKPQPQPKPKPAPKPKTRWSSVEVQVKGTPAHAKVTLTLSHGHWAAKGGRVKALSYNAAPLGG